jgi:hypothetical protein
MGAGLPPCDLIRALTCESRDRALTISAQSAADVQDDEPIDLSLGAVERPQHRWLIDPEPTCNSPPAQLLTANQAVNGAFAVVQLAQAVFDDPAVRCNRGVVLYAVAALVSRDQLEELPNRNLSTPRCLPEVLRPEAETHPKGASKMRLGREFSSAQDERDLLELVFVLRRRGVVPEPAAAHLAQNGGPPLVQERGDPVGA